MDLMTPLRRRDKTSKAAKAAKAARDLAFVRVVWAFARDRVFGKVPPARKRGGGKKRMLLIGGAATGAAAAGGLLKRRGANNGHTSASEHDPSTSNGAPDRTPTPAGSSHN